ncbi:phosphatase PAP2 family protein [Rhodococcus sp. H36-A4]|uniref:phosphatase PAP2 family protein n=1 Tax=Rhodococcus sp. H36-A4 TaxID=3004353 RepID=UPI0022B0346D|nr:phosphatase PAP2 family protein [Rhodococcus sp. H36-A4]MCZ4079945.1 phosphatase PAP2 family protein [Rhodococcus sp. H36-A4]
MDSDTLSAVLQVYICTLMLVLLSSSTSAVHSTVTEVFTEAASTDVEAVGLAVAFGLVILGIVLRTRDNRARGAIFSALGYAFAVLVLAVAVHSDGALTGADAPVAQWFVDHRSSTLDHLATAITIAGGPPETAALGILVAVVLIWRTKRYGPAVVVLATVAAASFLCSALKLIVGRDRPPLSMQLMLETDHSFPSGHVTGSAALLMMIALIASARCPTAARVLFLAITLAITVIVACTRMYLGVHWLTDVCAGALIAAAMVTLGGYALHRLDTATTDESTPTRHVSQVAQ